MSVIFRIGLWVVKFRGGRQKFIRIIEAWRSQQVGKVQFYHWAPVMQPLQFCNMDCSQRGRRVGQGAQR